MLYHFERFYDQFWFLSYYLPFKHEAKFTKLPKNVRRVPRCFEGPTTVSAAGTGRAARRVVLSISAADAKNYAACGAACPSCTDSHRVGVALFWTDGGVRGVMFCEPRRYINSNVGGKFERTYINLSKSAFSNKHLVAQLVE